MNKNWIWRALVRGFVFSFLVVFSSLQVFAAGKLRKPQIIKFENEKLRVMGVHYPNPGGIPVLLNHGLMGNLTNWEDEALELQKMGFDVYTTNMLGHGNGKLKSTVKNWVKGDYGFANNASAYLDFVTSEIYNRTGGKKIAMAGHSMGGMIARYFLGGLRAAQAGEAGDYVFDSERAKMLTERIRSFTTVGSPDSFHDAKPVLKYLARALLPLLPYLEGKVLPLGANVSHLEVTKIPLEEMSWAQRKKRDLLNKLLIQLMRNGVIYGPSLGSADSHEMLKLTEFGGSQELHGDMASDVIRWASSSKFTTPGGLNFEDIPHIYVPNLTVAAEFDTLASVRSIRQYFYSRLELGERIWFAFAPDTGHTDMIVGNRAVRMLLGDLVAFIYNPYNLGPVGTEFDLPEDGSSKGCLAFLARLVLRPRII